MAGWEMGRGSHTVEQAAEAADGSVSRGHAPTAMIAVPGETLRHISSTIFSRMLI
jgi:hypothetical protein